MSEHPQAKRASQAWWIAVILGAAAAVASFFVGGNRDGQLSVPAGLIAAALNPLVWLCLWAWIFRVNFEQQLAKCPHCGTWKNMNDHRTTPALGQIRCDTCGNIYLKPPA